MTRAIIPKIKLFRRIKLDDQGKLHKLTNKDKIKVTKTQDNH